ncbi:hypothetical protein HELRODRAFT_185250 [Helobdella robusta]|uniref:Uncharacterized protein n=1 Tax=Helobdella robusta TaxID=6412 RepID=T1FMK1_HELRO|nr:hypothetical protein HELRODRAFT_185250 [Helobdella robusta]ESO10568.1 hypothetical protein HELRODRAFT_185250 [Helobdella robusta]
MVIEALKSELLKYGENTSIRGIPKFFKSKDIFLKVLWLVFFITCTAVLIYLLITLFNKFYTWPVTTKYGEKVGQPLTFPDITICNLDPLAEGEPDYLKINEYLTYVENYKQDILNYLENANITGDDSSFAEVRNMFDEIFSVSGYIINLKKTRPESNDCPNFIVDCSFFGYNWFQTDAICTAENFTKRWNANYYTCYTLKTSSLLNISSSNNIRGLSLILNLGPPSLIQVPYKSSLTNSQARGVQVSVHSPGTSPDLKRGFNVAPGTENIVEIVQTERSRLDKPHNRLGCTNERNMLFSPTEKYTSDLCVEYCIQELINKTCGCVTHLLSVPEKYISDTDLCGNLTIYEYSDNRTDRAVFGLYCSLNNSDEDKASCFENCLMPCMEIKYDSFVTSASWPQPSVQINLFREYFDRDNDSCVEKNPKVKERYINYLKFMSEDRTEDVPLSSLTQIQESLLAIKFVMKQNFPYYQSENPAYTWDVMIGTVGGMLSLWLGITAASGVEIIELVYLLFKCCWNNKKSSTDFNTNNNKVNNQQSSNGISSENHLQTRI